MKHLKEFNSWTTTATDNVDVNYGDKKPEYSNIVKYAKNYIDDNIDNISAFDYDKNENVFNIFNHFNIKCYHII